MEKQTNKSIWIINQYATTPDMPGGTRHYSLGRELTKKNYDVTIFASSFHYSERDELKLFRNERWKVEKVDGVQFVWLKTFSYEKNDWRRVINMLSFMICSYRLGRNITKLDPTIPEPDIVIGSSVHLLAVLSAYWLSKHYQAKFIMEIRDLWPQTLIDMGALSERNPITKLLRALEKFLYQRAQKIITLMPKASAYIGSLGVDTEKLVWITNGVSALDFEVNNDQGNSSNYFTVMYLGAHGEANALDILLDAARIIQQEGYGNVKFLLIGDGPKKLRLKRRKEELGLDNVEFRNPVPKVKVPGVLARADATVFVLRDIDLYKYGISLNKMFDYMAAAKPVILAGNPVNNVIEEASCGIIVPPGNPDQLAEAIIQLYNTSMEERQAMGEKGRKYVEEYYNWSILAKKLERCIEEV